jgi:hypothetical protein
MIANMVILLSIFDMAISPSFVRRLPTLPAYRNAADTGAMALRENFETEKSRYNRNSLRVQGRCCHLPAGPVDVPILACEADGRREGLDLDRFRRSRLRPSSTGSGPCRVGEEKEIHRPCLGRAGPTGEATSAPRLEGTSNFRSEPTFFQNRQLYLSTCACLGHSATSAAGPCPDVWISLRMRPGLGLNRGGAEGPSARRNGP